MMGTSTTKTDEARLALLRLASNDLEEPLQLLTSEEIFVVMELLFTELQQIEMTETKSMGMDEAARAILKQVGTEVEVVLLHQTIALLSVAMEY